METNPKGVCHFTVLKKQYFRCPFDRYELNAFSESTTKQVTDRYNYGFNHITMKLFAQVSTRLRQAQSTLPASANSAAYPPSTLSDNYRLNDEIPLEFGGVGPPLDG